MTTCPNCQTQNRDNARFCARCGKTLQGAAPRASQPATPPAPGAQPSAVPPAPGVSVPVPITPTVPPDTGARAKRRPLGYVLIGCGMFLIGALCVGGAIGAFTFIGGGNLGLNLFASASATPATTLTITPTPTPLVIVVTLTPMPTTFTSIPTLALISTPTPTAPLKPTQTSQPRETATSKPQAGAIGQPAPGFQLEKLSGGDEFRFSGNAPTVLVFWKTNDGSADQQMTQLNDLYKRHRNLGLGVIGAEVGDPGGAVVDYFRRKDSAPSRPPHDYPVVLDTTQSVANLYGVTTTPTYFFIGRDGKIRDRVDGSISAVDLEGKASALL